MTHPKPFHLALRLQACVLTLALAAGAHSTCGAAVAASQPAAGETGITLFRKERNDASAAAAQVRELRRFQLQMGDSRIDIPDLPALVDPLTLRLRPAHDGIEVLEQSFRHDLGDVDHLLRFYLGRDILINRQQTGRDPTARNPETIHARLLAFDREFLVLETSNRQLPIQVIPRSREISEIKLMAQPDGPALRPTLSAVISTTSAGTCPLELSYQTRGLDWVVQYALCLREGGPADFSGIASVCNQSGGTFQGARLRLAWDLATQRGGNAGLDIPRRVNLNDGGIVQVPLFPARRRLSARTALVYDPQGVLPHLRPEPGTAAPIAVGALNECLVVEDASAPPVALPPGRLVVERVGREEGEAERLGETELPALASGRPLMIRLAPAPGVAGRRLARQGKQPVAGRGPAEEVEISLRNHRNDAVRVLVLDRFPGENAELLQSSHPAEREKDGVLRFEVQIPSGESAVIRYQLQPDE